MDESESEMEIKPKMVDGEPICHFECPQFGKLYGPLLCPYRYGGLKCLPGMEQQRDDALAENKRLKAEVEALKSGAIAELEKLYGRCGDRPSLIKAELGCMTCRNASRKVTDTYCDDCKLRDGSNGSKWQPLQHEAATHE